MTEETAPQGLRLRDVPATSAGRGLGLTRGDVLVAVNGVAFAGSVVALQQRLAQAAGDVALTFRRGPHEVTVLACNADLGPWESAPLPADQGVRVALNPARLRNYEVLRAADGRYDLFCRNPPVMAFVLPQLWLLQMRLWQAFAMLAAAVTAGFIVHPLLALAVHLAGAAHLRRSYAPYLRLDRSARGLGFATVLAAPSEAGAHAAYRAMQADDSYLFAPQRLQARPATV